MTLTIRLAVLAAIGALLAALTYHFLWSTPPNPVGPSVADKAPDAPAAGAYALKNKSGSYFLHLYDDRAARLEFTDRKGKHFGYQGELANGKIVWKQTLRGKKWIDIGRPVDDSLTIESPSVVVTREGRFQRVQK